MAGTDAAELWDGGRARSEIKLKCVDTILLESAGDIREGSKVVLYEIGFGLKPAKKPWNVLQRAETGDYFEHIMIEKSKRVTYIFR
jgi:hypothetical protein